MKKHITMRISALTEFQLTELTSQLGTSRTELITLAVNDFYNKMEEKMSSKNQLTQAHYDIIDWVGDNPDFINSLSAQQARDMLRWLQENEINIEKLEDIEKLRAYCDTL